MYSIKTNLTKAPNYYAVTFYDETGSPVGKCYIDTINVADKSPREQADFAINQVATEFSALVNDNESKIYREHTGKSIELSGESLKGLLAYVTADETVVNEYHVPDMHFDQAHHPQNINSYFDPTHQHSRSKESENEL